MTVQRVRIACPNCRQELHVRAAALGRKGLCRHCGHKFVAVAEGHDDVPIAHGSKPETRRRIPADGEPRPEFLAADLRDALGRLRLERNLHRAVREQLEQAWAKLAETQARERALHSQLAERDELRSELDELRAELAQREEDAARLARERDEHADEYSRLGQRVTELEGLITQFQSERDEIARRSRDQHERDDAECVALATEVARLQERLVELESDRRAAREELTVAAQAAKAAHDELTASYSRLTAERDTLARESADLAARLADTDAARETAERALRAAREQSESDRARWERQWRGEHEAVRRADADRWGAERDALRHEIDGLHARIDRMRQLRARAAQFVRRARARWTARLQEADTRWQVERRTLHEDFERSLRDRIEQFAIERRGLEEQLDAVRGTGDELDAVRREVESLRQLLDEVRAERDSALRRAEAQTDHEAVIAQLRDELAERSEELHARAHENEQALGALRQQADEQARERVEALQRLEQSEAEAASLRAAVAAAEASVFEARAAADERVRPLQGEVQAAARERDELRRRLKAAERERKGLVDSLRAAEALAGDSDAGAREQIERLRAAAEDAGRERDALRAQLDAQEQQRQALEQALGEAQAANEQGRQAALGELERLRQFATAAVQQRNEAVRRMQEAEAKVLQLPPLAPVPVPAAQARGLSPMTMQATNWLDSVLLQMSRLDLSAHPDKRILLERLRTVRQALAEQVAGAVAPVADRPRPRSEEFADSRQFRAALVEWLNAVRERRRAATFEFGRLRSELKSARSELELLDRDLVLGDWDGDGSAMFPVEAVAEVARAQSQAQLNNAG